MKTALSLAFALTFAASIAIAADGSVTGYYRAEGKDTKLSLCAPPQASPGRTRRPSR